MTTKYERQLIDDFINQLRLIAEHYAPTLPDATWMAHRDRLWKEANEKLEDLIDEVTYNCSFRDEDD